MDISEEVEDMAGNTSKKGKTLKIVLTIIISVVLACVLLVGGTFVYYTTPHTKHFTSVFKVSDNKIDGKYLYHVRSNGKVSILKADVDLSTVFESNSDEFDNLGEHDIKVKATGFENYKTDTSGITTTYPVIVYEYVGE